MQEFCTNGLNKASLHLPLPARQASLVDKFPKLLLKKSLWSHKFSGEPMAARQLLLGDIGAGAPACLGPVRCWHRLRRLKPKDDSTVVPLILVSFLRKPERFRAA